MLFTLGGGFNGIAPKLIGGGANSNSGTGMEGGSVRSSTRFTLREAWNGLAATGRVNNQIIKITPFRAVNNAGDLLCRVDYTSGGSNQVNNVRGGLTGFKGLGGSVQAHPDNSGIPSATCNVKYVYDSSDYTRFKNLQANNRNYNDATFGGDRNNSAQSAWRRVHRF